MNIHAWNSGILEEILRCGLSVMFITKSGRLAPSLEELTCAYVATPAAEAAKKAQSKGRLVPTDAGVQVFPGQRGSTAGRGGLLLGQGLLAALLLLSLSAGHVALPRALPTQKTGSGQVVCRACEIPITIFPDFTGLQRRSVIESATL